MDLLEGWYPGLGEVELIRRMSPTVREFVCDASEEYDGFISEYLLQVLDEYVCPEDKLLHDISNAVFIDACEVAGLSDYDSVIGLGELSGVLSKIKKAVKKVAKKVIAPVKKVIEKITPKPILNLQKKVAAGITRVNKAVVRTQEKTESIAGKVGKKYGNVIITAAGAVLAPFTGGASLAAAAALTAANSAYQKKRAADRAKQAASKDAAQLTAEAQQQQNTAAAQLDDFYKQNQQWFLDRGITPEKWAAMSFDQKVALLQGGLGSGSTPTSTTTTTPTSEPASSGGGYSLPSGGASGGGGGGGGGDGGGSSYAPSGQPQKPQIATASMFDSSMIPLLVLGAGLALVFGKQTSGGRRTRRNPSRRRRRAAA